MDLRSIQHRVASRFLRAAEEGPEKVYVKVNASVDRGVARVIEILSRIPHVMTTSSGQGKLHSNFYVEFIFDRTPEEATAFMLRLAEALPPDALVRSKPNGLDQLFIEFWAPNDDMEGIENRLEKLVGRKA